MKMARLEPVRMRLRNPSDTFITALRGSNAGDFARLVDQLSNSELDRIPTLILDELPRSVGADIVGFYLLSSPPEPREVYVRGAAEKALAEYEHLGRSADPVLRRALLTGRPTHQHDLLSPDEWHAHDLYRLVARQLPCEHYLLAPITAHGRIVATINLARRACGKPFDATDLVSLGVISGCLSAVYSHHRNEVAPGPPLTKRQREVAALVSRGFTNAQIGTCLGVSDNGIKQALKRIFERLDIGSRAELAAIVRATEP
jgi:DNA-binding CsgD family transcriptional regulator